MDAEEARTGMGEEDMQGQSVGMRAVDVGWIWLFEGVVKNEDF